MSARILVLGAAGRLGEKAAEAFRDAGWIVTSLVRPGGAAPAPCGTGGAGDTGARPRRDWQGGAGARRRPTSPHPAVHGLVTAGPAACLFRRCRGRDGRRYAAFSRQSLQLRFAAAADHRRERTHATIIAQGTAASGDRRSHDGSG